MDIKNAKIRIDSILSQWKYEHQLVDHTNFAAKYREAAMIEDENARKICISLIDDLKYKVERSKEVSSSLEGLKKSIEYTQADLEESS